MSESLSLRTLRETTGESLRMTVHYRSADGWQPCAVAHARALTEPLTEPNSKPPFVAPPRTEPDQQFYENLTDFGYHYGPSYRSLVHKPAGEHGAYLASNDSGAYLLDPALLDGCVHSTLDSTVRLTSAVARSLQLANFVLSLPRACFFATETTTPS